MDSLAHRCEPRSYAVNAAHKNRAQIPRLTGRRCACSGCGEIFNSTSVFDRHRIGTAGVNRRCLTVEEMTARGFSRNARGFWRERAQSALGAAQSMIAALAGARPALAID